MLHDCFRDSHWTVLPCIMITYTDLFLYMNAPRMEPHCFVVFGCKTLSPHGYMFTSRVYEVVYTVKNLYN